MKDKYKTGECRKFVFWVVYDATGDRQFVKMDSDTGCLAMFDNEESAAAFASGLFGVEYKEVVLYQQPPEPVGYVSPRLLDALRSGKACGIAMEDKPDAHNGVTIPLYTAQQPVEQQPISHDWYASATCSPKKQPAPDLEDLLSSKKDFYNDAIEDIAFALALECEEAELDPGDKVTINREKLKAIAARVLEKAEAKIAQQQPAPHPDDAAVDRFAAVMKAKLNKKRQEGRGGWQSLTAEQLSALLHEHVRKVDPVDVANLAMMLHQNGQRIEQIDAACRKQGGDV